MEIGMKNELAKRLKEAGFPQPIGNVSNIRGWFTTEGYLPTLEELIDACGTDLFWLEQNRDGSEWKVFRREDIMDEDVQFGNTPLEAVARLFIKLNK